MNIFKYNYVPNIAWDILTLKNDLLLIWNPRLTGHPAFYLAMPLRATVRTLSRTGSPWRVSSRGEIPSNLWFESFSLTALRRTEWKSNTGRREARWGCWSNLGYTPWFRPGGRSRRGGEGVGCQIHFEGKASRTPPLIGCRMWEKEESWW